MNALRIVAAVPPGRFPTVVADPGGWWSHLAGHDLSRFSANAAWWRTVCSSEVGDALQLPPPRRASFLGRRFRRPPERDLRSSGQAATVALAALQDSATYATTASYVETIGQIADHLAALNDAQDELRFDFQSGVVATAVDYDDSESLVEYASRDTRLSSLLALAVRSAPPDIRLLLLSVTTPQDLLTALVMTRVLRASHPRLHASLIDHGYENFTLRPHIDALRRTGQLTRIFDTIIVSKDARDVVVPWLAAALAAGAEPQGFLAGDRAPLAVHARVEYEAPPPVPTFSPEPILWTRISPRRCYWSRCTFCIQNLKYDDLATPELAEVEPAIDRLDRLAAAGYRTCIFSDEALSPALVRRLSERLIARRIPIRWACRCKLELKFTPELFELMARAGCYEVLYGLESISPRVQQLMDKYVEGLDADRIRAIFDAAGAAGIGLHINLMGGFPGDSVEELDETVDFVVEAAAPLDHVTVTLNTFALFPDTPVMQEPFVFGVEPLPAAGDMPAEHRYRLFGPAAQTALVHDWVPRSHSRLMTELGWADLAATEGGSSAIDLYFSSGHGSVFKCRRGHGFVNPLGGLSQGVRS